MREALILFAVILLNGCTAVNSSKEILKEVWGSSTKALEEARSNAITKTYYKPYWDVVKSTRDVIAKNRYIVFKEDEVKGYLVLMGIKGSVNTTEVGVFYVEENDHQTRIEISSLSTNAKRIAARNLFHGLDIVFGLAPPDPEPNPVSDDQTQDKKP